jgi:hypothetical protein
VQVHRLDAVAARRQFALDVQLQGHFGASMSGSCCKGIDE